MQGTYSWTNGWTAHSVACFVKLEGDNQIIHVCDMAVTIRFQDPSNVRRWDGTTDPLPGAMGGSTYHVWAVLRLQKSGQDDIFYNTELKAATVPQNGNTTADHGSIVGPGAARNNDVISGSGTFAVNAGWQLDHPNLGVEEAIQLVGLRSGGGLSIKDPLAARNAMANPSTWDASMNAVQGVTYHVIGTMAIKRANPSDTQVRGTAFVNK